MTPLTRHPLSISATRLSIALCATASLSSAFGATPANRFWDGINFGGTGDGASTGGAATWDTTNLNWDQGDTLNRVAWDNANNDIAIFAGTAGIVSLAGGETGDITAGKLDITGAYAIALLDSFLTISGSDTALSFNGAATISAAPLGKIVVGASQTWANTTGRAVVSAPTDTGANLLTLSTGNNNLDVTGKISGTGGLTVNSTGATWSNANTTETTLSASNDYTGTTSVNGGIYLATGNLAELGADTSDINLNTGGFRLGAAGTITRGLNLTGSCGIARTTSGTTILNGPISGNGGFGTFANFNNAAVFELAVANSFSGDCTLGVDNILRLAHVDALANSTLTGLNAARASVDLTTKNLAYVIGGIKGSGDLNLGTGLGTSSGTGSGSVSFGNNDQSNTYTGVLSGSAGFTKIGTGTQTLTGPNAYTGPTVVNSGKLIFNAGAQVGNSDFSVADTATLGVQPLPQSPALQLTCKSLTLASGTTTGDFNFSSFVPSTTLAPLQVNGNLTNNGTLDVTVPGGAFVTGSVYPLIKYTGTGAVGSLGSVTLPGGATGTLVHNAANQSIDLNVTTGNQIVWNGGSGPWDVETTANWMGDVTYTHGNAVLFDDTSTGSGILTVTLSAAMSPSFVTVNNSALEYKISGVISGSTGLLKSGANKLTLLSANTYTGATTVNAGTLAYGVNSALASGGVTVNGASAILDLVSFTDTVGAVTLDGGGQITGTGTLTSTATFEMVNGTANIILGGNLIALNKTGAGTVTLNKLNTYSGLTTVKEGTLAYGITDAIGSGSVTVNGPTAVLSLGAFNDSVTTVTLDGGGQITGSGTLTTSGSFEMKDGTASINFGGTRTLNKTTAGTVLLGGNNSYTGATNISAGILKLGAAGSGSNSPLGTTAGITSVTAGAALDLNGFTLNTAEPLTLRGTGVSSGGALMNSSANAATYSGLVTLGAASSMVAGSGDIILSNTGTIAGNTFGLTLDGAATGSRIDSIIGTTTGTVTKQGAGTWTLAGVNAYTGATAVNAGTLVVNGSTAAGSAATVAAAGTLSGTGTVAGSVSVSGKVAPGLVGATGTLTTGNVAFTATGEYVCTVDGANCDVLAAGNLTVDAAAKVSISGTPTAASYLIATYTGAEPTHFDESSLPSGYALDYTEAGKIKLVQGGGGTPFENWASAPPYNLSGNDALPDADPDKDGVTNIVEFALGGNPTNGSANGASLVKVQDVAGSPALTLTILTRSGTSFGIGTTGPRTAIKDGVTYTIEGGQNLSVWTGNIAEVTPAITTGMASAPAGYEYHTFKSAGPVASTAKDFIRVGVVGQ